MTPPPRDRVALRFRDLDAFGHVYHAEYLTLLDELRTRWLDEVLGLQDAQSYVVARVEIDYVSSLTGDDTSVGADLAVAGVGTTSITLRETLFADDGRAVACTRAVIVLRDPATGAGRPVSDLERAACVTHAVRE